MRPTRFTSVASAIALTSVLLGGFGPAAVGAERALAASLAVSAVVGAVFAAYNVYSVREYGQPRLAAAFLTTVFGLWLVAAPILYDASGFAVLATAQGFGTLVASFGGYTAIEALELVARRQPLATGCGREPATARTSDRRGRTDEDQAE
jgi:hypothetical protein